MIYVLSAASPGEGPFFVAVRTGLRQGAATPFVSRQFDIRTRHSDYRFAAPPAAQLPAIGEASTLFDVLESNACVVVGVCLGVCLMFRRLTHVQVHLWNKI